GSGGMRGEDRPGSGADDHQRAADLGGAANLRPSQRRGLKNNTKSPRRQEETTGIPTTTPATRNGARSNARATTLERRRSSFGGSPWNRGDKWTNRESCLASPRR